MGAAMDNGRSARNGAGLKSRGEPDDDRPPWLRQLLGSRPPSQPPVPRMARRPYATSIRWTIHRAGPLARRSILWRARTRAVSARLGGRRDIAAEQTAMMDIARPDLVECPRCGAANYDNASRCAECGYVLLISCPRCGLVNRTGTMQCARCGLFLSQPTGAPRTGAYGVAAPASHPLPPFSTGLPRVVREPPAQRPLGRWILTTLVALALVRRVDRRAGRGLPAGQRHNRKPHTHRHPRGDHRVRGLPAGLFRTEAGQGATQTRVSRKVKEERFGGERAMEKASCGQE